MPPDTQRIEHSAYEILLKPAFRYKSEELNREERGVRFVDRRDLIIESLKNEDLGELVLGIKEDINKLYIGNLGTSAMGKVTIKGNVGGYKTGGYAPNLSIEILGNVDNDQLFLYGAEFRRMEIFGDVLSRDPFPGWSGDLIIHGSTPNYDIDKKENRTGTVFNLTPVGFRCLGNGGGVVAEEHARGIPGVYDCLTGDFYPARNWRANIWIGGRQVLKQGWYVDKEGTLIYDDKLLSKWAR